MWRTVRRSRRVPRIAAPSLKAISPFHSHRTQPITNGNCKEDICKEDICKEDICKEDICKEDIETPRGAGR